MGNIFYETDPAKNNSPICSPLVIAPKATAPFIRFCGDYRKVNEYITIPQDPIPVVIHELTKAAKFKVFIDLDMANSFHQIPLSEEFSNILSVKTPWGLVRPKFLPEGVGPASGLLQRIVREIFSPFEEWTIVIFDNFLVLADDYQDAYKKLKLILDRCAEYGVVLKMKKSFIGVDKVNFFGYEVTHGKWQMSQTRKDAIDAFQFPHIVGLSSSRRTAALNTRRTSASSAASADDDDDDDDDDNDDDVVVELPVDGPVPSGSSPSSSSSSSVLAVTSVPAAASADAERRKAAAASTAPPGCRAAVLPQMPRQRTAF